ncbi:MAG TPA: gliding motility protein GldN, partial [Paludibacter sp.]|nr:gliding motility protein GldN [Paludibacter sp.]
VQSFFNKKGAVALQTTQIDGMADTIAVINHRMDDIVWSRIVYRVIDMREKQNYQLYFPMRPNDEYKSLFRLMLTAITDGLPVYRRNPREIRPSFEDRVLETDLPLIFAYDDYRDNDLIQVDSITNVIKIGEDQYQQYIKTQLKFLTQEIIFFDKHYSRMFSKIIAIAPMNSNNPNNARSKITMDFFRESVLCWFSFDELRPYLAKQYVIPNGNETQRLTFDVFFAQKYYSSYLLGDANMFNRTLLESFNDPNKIRIEQKRIENELLNFELDLWEF